MIDQKQKILEVLCIWRFVQIFKINKMIYFVYNIYVVLFIGYYGKLYNNFIDYIEVKRCYKRC